MCFRKGHKKSVDFKVVWKVYIPVKIKVVLAACDWLSSSRSHRGRLKKRYVLEKVGRRESISRSFRKYTSEEKVVWAACDWLSSGHPVKCVLWKRSEDMSLLRCKGRLREGRSV